jgi:hypothetical protein
MNHVRIACSLLALVAAGCTKAGPGTAARPEEAHVPGPPAKPPAPGVTLGESPVLGRYVGTWEGSSVTKAEGWSVAESRSEAVTVYEWGLKGRLLTKKSKDKGGVMEVLDLLAYDPDAKEFRGWHFDSMGKTSEARGTWDEATQTLTLRTDLGGGVTGVTRERFVDAGTTEWTFLATDAEGKVCLDAGGKMRRRK